MASTPPNAGAWRRLQAGGSAAAAAQVVFCQTVFADSFQRCRPGLNAAARVLELLQSLRRSQRAWRADSLPLLAPCLLLAARGAALVQGITGDTCSRVGATAALRHQQHGASRGWRRPQRLARRSPVRQPAGGGASRRCAAGGQVRAARLPARLVPAAAAAAPLSTQGRPEGCSSVLHVMAGSQGAPRGLHSNCRPPASAWRRLEPARAPVGAQPPHPLAAAAHP